MRLFDFILRRRPFERVGNQVINVRKRFTHEDKEYEYLSDTRGYYYQLKQPIPVLVTRGNIKGKAKGPIEGYMQKPGVEEESIGPSRFGEDAEVEEGAEGGSVGPPSAWARGPGRCDLVAPCPPALLRRLPPTVL